MLLLIIVLLLLVLGGGGGYYGYSRWGPRGGLGVVGTVLLIVVVLYLVGALR
jgi:flagellin-like protein